MRIYGRHLTYPDQIPNSETMNSDFIFNFSNQLNEKSITNKLEKLAKLDLICQKVREISN